MLVRGILSEVGQPRDWTDKNGVKKQCVTLLMRIPCGAREGNEFFDEIMGEISFGNPEFLNSLKRICEAKEVCEFQLRFSLVDWNEKKIQNIRVFNLSKPLI